MRIIVDTNKIIAALIRDSISRKILLSDKFEFLTVGITKSEIEEHKEELLEKTNLTEEQLKLIFSLLFSRIFVVTDAIIENKMREAREIMDRIDPADTPFIALALSVENDGIWSDDDHFDRQNKIKIWRTNELIKILNKI